MTAAAIAFTDGTGAASLTGWTPAPADRFANWVPMTRDVGESATRQSDRATSMFVFSTDYGCSFEVHNIPIAAVSGVRLVEIADRLIAHLLRGGTCSVTTGGPSSITYATCGIMPGTTPTLTPADPHLLEHTLSLSLINLGSAAAMVCRYA